MRLQKEGDIEEYSAVNVQYADVNRVNLRGQKPDQDQTAVTPALVRRSMNSLISTEPTTLGPARLTQNQSPQALTPFTPPKELMNDLITP